MSNIDHIVLYLLLFPIFYFWGKFFFDTKSRIKFWTSASIPILLYSTIIGSRYGWGADYKWYKYKFESHLRLSEEQIGFKYLNIFIYNIGLSYVGAFIIYSLIFCVLSVILIRSYRKYSKYMYGLLIPSTLIFTTNIIRQGVALSFVSTMIYFINKRNYLLSAICIIIGAQIHTTILITCGILLCFYFFYNRPIALWVSIPLYLIFTFIVDPSSLTFLANTFSTKINLGNKFQFYLDNSDRWFGEDGVRQAFEQNTFTKITSSLFHLSIITLGYYALKIQPSEKISYIYNSVVVGFIMLRMFFLFEILRRLSEPLIMYYYITLGYSISILYRIPNEKISQTLKHLNLREYKVAKQTRNIGLVIILTFLIMFWGRFIFLNNESNFFWNITHE